MKICSMPGLVCRELLLLGLRQTMPSRHLLKGSGRHASPTARRKRNQKTSRDGARVSEHA